MTIQLQVNRGSDVRAVMLIYGDDKYSCILLQEYL